MPGVTSTTHAKITSGGTTSGEVDMRGLRLKGVQIPAAFTSATMIVQAAEKSVAEGGVYGAVTFTSGTGATVPFSLTVTAGESIWLGMNQLPGNCFLRFVAAGAEGADRDLILYLESTP